MIEKLKIPRDNEQYCEATTFFNKQSIFDPRPKNCLSLSKKLPQKIVWQLFNRWSINFLLTSVV